MSDGNNSASDDDGVTPVYITAPTLTQDTYLNQLPNLLPALIEDRAIITLPLN